MHQISIRYIYSFILLIAGLTACQPNKKQSEKKDATPPVRVYNVQTFGAKGDGRVDDTKNIQTVIDQAKKGDTVFIPSGIYKVKTLVLRTGIHIKCVGLLRQSLPVDTQLYSIERQNSSFPVFYGKELDQVSLSFHAESLNEGVYIYNSKHITITNSSLKGSKKFRSYPGILIFRCDSVQIRHTEISQYGLPRLSSKSYQPGTAIRILASHYIRLERNALHHNGENGIFMHGSGQAIIKRNLITHNGMSGIQIGFGSSKAERDFEISYNKIEENAADAIDINNRVSPEPLNINCYITHNRSRNNGFVKGESTVDGSGIATLINLDNVHVKNNVSVQSNRPSLYLENCGNILVEGNQADNKIEVVERFKQLQIKDNQFDALSLLANAKGGKIDLDKNEMRTLLLPNGIQVDTLIMNENVLKNANLNFNFNGRLWMKENDIQSKVPTGALVFNHILMADIEENNITSKASYGLFIDRNAQQVHLKSNKIEALNACIYDAGAKNLRITDNQLIALPGGRTQRTLISRNPQAIQLNGNEHQGGKSDNSIRFEGEGTALIGRETFTSGFPDYGKVTIKSL